MGGGITQFVLAGEDEFADYNCVGTTCTPWTLTVRGVGGLPVAAITPATGTQTESVAYYHHDVQGSTVAATTPGRSGAVETYTYSEFGAPSGGSYFAYRFAGYRYDTETGLYYVRARYYSATLGRFLQPDPIGTKGGTNLYAYVNNDPINGVDPLGLCALSDQSEQAILNSSLTGPQAIAFENAVHSAGAANGIDPNVLVGMGMKESSLDPTAQSSTSSAAGMFGLTRGVRNATGLDNEDATGSSPAAIQNQVDAAASYLSGLMGGPVPSSHPDHSLEIAIGYYRGSRSGVNAAIASPGGYGAMLNLSYGGETLGHYINYVESFR